MLIEDKVKECLALPCDLARWPSGRTEMWLFCGTGFYQWLKKQVPEDRWLDTLTFVRSLL